MIAAVGDRCWEAWEMAVKTHKTFCRVCGSGCGIEVDVDGERVVRVRGDKSHPLTQGYTCSKGRGLPDIHHGADRLLVPKMRVDGALRPAGWDQVLDDLGARLRKVIAESGPESIAVNLGGGGYMDSSSYMIARDIPRLIGTPAFYTTTTIDVISKMIVPEMVGGFSAVMTRPDFARCRMVMYVGTNPLVSHGHTSMLNNPAQRMREMCAKGEVWVLDPRKTETAAKATRHLAPRQNTDYAVLAFLVREILKDGADRDYLTAHAQDVEGLAKAVDRFTVDAAADISGLPPDDLLALLDAVRRVGRLSVETGTGLSMAMSGNVTQWLSWALMIVTGSLDREGGSWGHPGFLLKFDEMFAAMPPAPPEGWRGPGPKSRPELPSIQGEYPCVAIPDEIEAGNMRAMINLSGNIVASMPHTNRLMAALAKLDVLATVEIVETPTVKASTHVFPAKDQLERPDLPLAVDTFFPTLAAQYTPPIVKPLGDVRSYWWILGQIGKRIDLDFFPGLDVDTATDEDIMRRMAANGRRSFDDIRDQRFVIADTNIKFGWMLDLADRVGGWRLAPAELVKQLDTIEPPAPLVLISRRPAHRMNSRVMDPRGGGAALHVSPEDAANAGLKSGSMAIVRSPHGAVKGVVKIDRSLRQGVMNVPHGLVDADNVNHLTSGNDVEPFTGMPRYSGLPVSLEAVSLDPVPDAAETAH
jgi:anaerobic selenocysteine-containing dehydrogenase